MMYDFTSQNLTTEPQLFTTKLWKMKRDHTLLIWDVCQYYILNVNMINRMGAIGTLVDASFICNENKSENKVMYVYHILKRRIFVCSFQ